MAYIKGVDRTRYGVLAAELKNGYAKGQDDYPTDLATAFALVNLYETPKNEQLQQHDGNHRANNQQAEHNIHTATKTEDGYTFVQDAANNPPVAGTDGRYFERTLCYNCQAYGHYAVNCNEPNVRGTTLVYHGVVMTQTDEKNTVPSVRSGSFWTPNQPCWFSTISSISQTSERVRKPYVS